MKYILSIVTLGLCMTTAYAQRTDSAKVDSVFKTKRISISVKVNSKKDSVKKTSKSTGLSFKLTFARFDLGLVKLRDNGSFSLSPANSFLDYNGWKSSNTGFDFLEFGYRFDSYFKIYLSGGFDWNHLHLVDNITILRNKPVLSYSTDAVNYHKNRFTSSYFRLPLSFEFKGKDDKNGKKMHLVFGPDAGFLINGRVKQKSKENGKQKFDDDYHFSRFRYGGFARIGYGGAGLYFKYFANDTFENSPAQKGLKNMSFGLMFGF
jgi:hypothetical protein